MTIDNPDGILSTRHLLGPGLGHLVLAIHMRVLILLRVNPGIVFVIALLRVAFLGGVVLAVRFDLTYSSRADAVPL